MVGVLNTMKLKLRGLTLAKVNKRKICPKCGLEGTGPYARWVLNSRKQRFEPYFYFSHKKSGKIRWCYLGRLSNMARCVDCSNLQADNFCTWQGAFIKKSELLTQPFDCEGYQPKIRKLSNNQGCGWKAVKRYGTMPRG